MQPYNRQELLDEVGGTMYTQLAKVVKTLYPDVTLAVDELALRAESEDVEQVIIEVVGVELVELFRIISNLEFMESLAGKEREVDESI